MINAVLLALLATFMIGPPFVLSRRKSSLRWRTKYILSLMPAAYTGLGWMLGGYAYDVLGCHGGFKNVNTCLLGNSDLTPVVGYGLFLSIPFLFVALPMTLLLLIETAANQIGIWHKKNGTK